MSLRSEVETRLRNALPDLKEVGGAVSLPQLLEGRLSAPAVYVIAERRDATRNPYGTAAVSQRIETSVLCVVVNRNVRSSRGEDAADDADTLCARVRDAVVGWTAASAVEPFDYLGGQLLAYPDQHHIWAERFRTASYLRK